MRRLTLLFSLFLLVLANLAFAQEATPESVPSTPQPVTPALPFATSAAPATVVPPAQDARLAACAAPTAPNFLPYTVRAGDGFLADLLIGSRTITPTQLAALNCLDNSVAPPPGVILWLPADAFAVASEATTAATEATTATNTVSTITSFTANAETVLNDQGVTLNWEAQGQSAYVYLCPSSPEIPCKRPRSAQPLPLTGSVSLGNFWRAGQVAFRLEVIGEGTAEPATQDVTVEVTCAQASLGNAAPFLCPEEPARTVTAVWQPFEGGVMMWFSDTQQIYVMTNFDGRVRVFQDQYVEGSPDPDAVAPEGLLTPIRGFGQVWQALGGAETSGLGWALSPEIGFDSARQPAGRTSYTTYIQGPGETVYAITEIPGMDMGYWAQVGG